MRIDLIVTPFFVILRGCQDCGPRQCYHFEKQVGGKEVLQLWAAFIYLHKLKSVWRTCIILSHLCL